MSDIPDEAAEAAAKALHQDAANRNDMMHFDTWEKTPHGFKELFRARARAALTAAAPIIRADERRRVVAEIRAQKEHAYQDEWKGADYANGMEHAAEIAERHNQ